MPKEPVSITEFFNTLPSEKAADMRVIREVILANLQPGFVESVSKGMIHYSVTHDLYPAGYHCDPRSPLGMAALAPTKGGMSIHMFGLYCDPAMSTWFHEAYKATGKKLDMGAACIRFKNLADVPLDVIGELFARITVEKFVRAYETALGPRLKR